MGEPSAARGTDAPIMTRAAEVPDGSARDKMRDPITRPGSQVDERAQPEHFVVVDDLT